MNSSIERVDDRPDDGRFPLHERFGFERRRNEIAVFAMLLALHGQDRRTDEQPDGLVVDVRIEHLAVTEHSVDRVEGHRGVQVLRSQGVGRLGPVHDRSLKYAGLFPLLREERIGVTKEVYRRVDRDVLHWAFHS